VRRGAALLPVAAVLFASLLGVARSAAAAEIVADAAVVRDFMIQNVCLDTAGAVVIGHSPIDGGACAAQRDLRPGERLPYHKHDHAPPEQATEAPQGYQRHDSFPVGTAGFPGVVEHSFDFGVGEGRRFGVFDTGSDGGDAAILSPGIVTFGATEDGGAGFQLFVGECSGPVNAAALAHGWILAEYDPAGRAPLQGETVAHLNNLTKGRQASCPAHFNAAYTTWRVVPFRYRAGRGQGTPIRLTTLISEHYGGADPVTADHVERFYFTRELGGTRWERWQNLKGNAQASPQQVKEAGAWFAQTDRCSTPEPPAGGAAMVMVDCREWTHIVPPSNPAGDLPGFFIKQVRTRPDAPSFFRTGH
jgi:hypothetical protein